MMRAYLAMVLCTVAAAQAEDWTVLRHTDCAPQAATVLWGTPFEQCLKKSDQKSFMYTNERWTARSGCILSQGPCTSHNCTAGACGNWDSYYCASGKCAPPKPPPPPSPHPAPAPEAPAGLVHRALGSHMVLQRDAPARIWGSATGEVTVTVSGGGGTEIQTTKAASNGSWSVDLRPRNATVAPSQITVACPSCTAAADKQVVLTDVLFGDVFVCGGQSNMAFGLGQDINASLECPATAGFPHIRHTTFSSNIPWAVSSPATTCTGKGFAPFSAVCWYFGKDVFESLGGAVPVGLVSSNVGGTAVERWSSPDALAHCNQTGVVQQSNLWIPHIIPILPMQVQGWIWYQAESNVACSVSWKWMPGLNCGIGCSAANPVCNASITGCADFYACQFPAMITDWKQKWNGGMQTNAGRPKPFLFVELAPYTEGAGEPFDKSVSAVRMAQMAALELPLVGMAAAYDYGDSQSPLGNIHPEYKAPVGQRLAWGARALAYGEKIAYKNPKLVSATTVSADNDLLASKLLLKFDTPVEVRSGHVGRFDASINAFSKAWLSVNGVNATLTATNEGDVEATVPSSERAQWCGGAEAAVSVEYLQGDWPVPAIYAKGSGVPGLPAAPFIAKAAVTCN